MSAEYDEKLAEADKVNVLAMAEIERLRTKNEDMVTEEKLVGVSDN